MNTYNWIINKLQCYPEVNGNANVVFLINWRRQAWDELGHNAEVYGAQLVTFNPNAQFTPYENLTKEQVEGWLEAALGVDNIATLNAELDRQITEQVTPSIVRPPLPW